MFVLIAGNSKKKRKGREKETRKGREKERKKKDKWFILVGPENSLIDGKDYFRPIITPFELEIALVQ